MIDQDGFIAAIKAEPADDTRRLAYADWLDENAQHDRDLATAEFIRMSCKDVNTGKVRKSLDRQVGIWLCGRVYNGPMNGEGSLNMGRLIPTLAQWVDQQNRDYIEKRGKPGIEYKREGRWLKLKPTRSASLSSSNIAGSNVSLEFWRGFVRQVVVHCDQCADVALPLIIPDQPLCEPIFSGYTHPKKTAKATNLYRAYMGDAAWRNLLTLPPPWKPDVQGTWNGHDRVRWEDWETRPELPPHAVRARWAICIAMHAAAKEIIDGKRESGVPTLKAEVNPTNLEHT